MKILLFFIGLLLFSTVNAAPIGVCHSGSWYSPDRVGEGISLEVLEDQVVLYFYTYRDGDKDWYIMQGARTTTSAVSLEIFATEFEAKEPFTVDVYDVGDAVVEIIDDNTLSFEFVHTLDIQLPGTFPFCLADRCTGVHEYIRLTSIVDCEAP